MKRNTAYSWLMIRFTPLSARLSSQHWRYGCVDEFQQRVPCTHQDRPWVSPSEQIRAEVISTSANWQEEMNEDSAANRNPFRECFRVNALFPQVTRKIKSGFRSNETIITRVTDLRWNFTALRWVTKLHYKHVYLYKIYHELRTYIKVIKIKLISLLKKSNVQVLFKDVFGLSNLHTSE